MMDKAMGRYGIDVPDRQLACAPVRSPEGRGLPRRRWPRPPTTAAPTASCSPRRCAGSSTAEVGDVARPGLRHLAQPGQARDARRRRPATRRCACTARARPGRCRPATPTCRRTCAAVGQPVLIPGTMGTASYVLAGVAGGPAFCSTCHGAGRVQSRHQAAQRYQRQSAPRRSWRPGASWCAARRGAGSPRRSPRRTRTSTPSSTSASGAGLARKVARLVPLGVVKG